MFKFFVTQKRRAGEGGFTLIELVVVLAILGILLALAVPRYLGARKRAYKAEIDNILQEVKTLSWAYYQEHDIFPTAPAQIALSMPSGAAWTTPVISNGGGSGAFIEWTSSGIVGGAPVEDTDLCSVTLSNQGDAAQGCTF
ncbi:MAG: type II secretion system protein [bacterium]